jgi:hypothetical protein
MASRRGVFSLENGIASFNFITSRASVAPLVSAVCQRGYTDYLQQRTLSLCNFEAALGGAKTSRESEGEATHLASPQKRKIVVVLCWLLAVGCWLLAVGCWLFAIAYWLLAVVYCLLSSCGYWLLAIVYWLLSIGYCPAMAIGYWLLAILS